MKKYIGTKQIEAEPMTMGEAYAEGLLQVGRVPTESERLKPGFKVRYEGGYTSWSPEEAFNQAYRIAETPLDRMAIESEDLGERTAKLAEFIVSEKFQELDEHIQALLSVQYSLMNKYLAVLSHRSQCMKGAKNTVKCFSFGEVIGLLKAGFVVRRFGWNGKGLSVFKQVPAHIGSDIIPKMQSLPQRAKDLILEKKGSIDYTSQCLIYNETTGRADSWVPSISDVFAEDWEIV